ncbi:MAG: FMN-binding negative transcriptional regulator [Rhodospirillales bacterium]
MFVPAAFAVTDRQKALGFVDAWPFAVLVAGGDSLEAVHLPLLRDGNRLLGHVARVNPIWRRFEAGASALAAFSGPHGYVSPTWYTSRAQVPTWNYMAVHVSGPVALLDAEDARASMVHFVSTFETGPGAWRLDEVPGERLDAMLKAIVAFEMKIETLEAKAKLSQNKTEADRAGVMAGLRETGDGEAHALADAMQAFADLKAEPLSEGERP